MENAPPHPQTIRSGDFFVVDGTGLEQHVPSAAKAIKAPVGLWLVRGSQPVGMSTGMRERSGDFFVVDGTGREQGGSAVSGLQISLYRRCSFLDGCGILGLVQQIGICGEIS